MGYQHIQVPQSGEKITVNADFSLNVPNHPIIPFITHRPLFEMKGQEPRQSW